MSARNLAQQAVRRQVYHTEFVFTSVAAESEVKARHERDTTHSG
jgi:hypothetical protein